MQTITIETFTPSEKLPEEDSDVIFVQKYRAKKIHYDGYFDSNKKGFYCYFGSVWYSVDRIEFWYYKPYGDTRQ